MADDKDIAAERCASHDAPISAGAQDSVATPPQAVDADAATPSAADVVSAQDTEPSAAGVEERLCSVQELIEFLRAFTSPDVLSGRWSFLGGQDQWLRIDMPPVEFLKAVAEEYSPELLGHFGLYEHVDGELRPAAWLDSGAPLFVAITENPGRIRFSAGNEFLFPMVRTARDYALERIPRDSGQMPDTLFIGASPDDVLVMRRLGLAAVSYEGLETLSSQDREVLFDGDHQTDFRWRYRPVLMDFDVARVQNRPTGAIGEVIRRLADGADVYDIVPGRRFAVCRPSAHEFQVFEQAIAFKDSTRIYRLLETWSIAAKSIRIHSWRTHFIIQAPSFSAAKQALASALQRSNGVARRVEVLDALPAYREAGRRTVMQKFHAAIDRASDPFAQVDLIAAAAYAEEFLDNDPLVRAAESVLTHGTPPSDEEFHEKLFEKRQRSLVELRRIRRDSKNQR